MGLRFDAQRTGTALLFDGADQFASSTHVWVTITSITSDPVSVFNILDGPPAIGDQFLWPLATRAGNPTTLNPDGSFTVGPPTQALDWIDGVEYYDSAGDQFDGPVDYSISDTLAIQIEPLDLASASTLSSPTLTQTHQLAPLDLLSASTLSEPSAGTILPVDPLPLNSASTLSTPTLTQTHDLDAADLTSASSLSEPTLVEVVNVTPLDLSSASTLSEPALDLTLTVVADPLTSATTLSEVVLTQTHSITPQRLVSGSTLSESSVFIPAEEITPDRMRKVELEQRFRKVPFEQRYRRI